MCWPPHWSERHHTENTWRAHRGLWRASWPICQHRLAHPCNRRASLSILSLAVAAAIPLVMNSTARANSGVQLPLNQYQAGSETTQTGPIINPGFEQPGVAGPDATGWTNTGAMSVAAP